MIDTNQSFRCFALASALLSTASLVGCKGREEPPPGGATPVASLTPPPAAPLAAAPAPSVAEPVPSAPAEPVRPTVELQIASVANTMAYDKTKLTVKAGDPVHLVLTNHSTMAILPHNWVLVKPGAEAAVALGGLPKGEEGGYITPGPDVLAFTPLAGPGKTTEVTFTAPPAGRYPYVCTVPGHYMMMKGILETTP